MDTMKRIGYRIGINSLTMPAIITAGARFSVRSTWSNAGITPAYNLWNVMVQLRRSNGKVVWQGKSRLNMQKLLPTRSGGIDKPVSIGDTFRLKRDVAAGRYLVSLEVLDPRHYYVPMRLANYHRSVVGSYPLGKITIRK